MLDINGVPINENEGKLLVEKPPNVWGRKLYLFETADKKHFIKVVPTGEEPFYEMLTDEDYENVWKPVLEQFLEKEGK